MLDVPIYGRIATLELFRPHVRKLKAYVFFELLSTVVVLFFHNVFFCLFVLVSNRVKHRIIFLLQLKDTNSVFFNGILKLLSLLHGMCEEASILSFGVDLLLFCLFLYR